MWYLLLFAMFIVAALIALIIFILCCAGVVAYWTTSLGITAAPLGTVGNADGGGSSMLMGLWGGGGSSAGGSGGTNTTANMSILSKTMAEAATINAQKSKSPQHHKPSAEVILHRERKRIAAETVAAEAAAAKDTLAAASAAIAMQSRIAGRKQHQQGRVTVPSYSLETVPKAEHVAQRITAKVTLLMFVGSPLESIIYLNEDMKAVKKFWTELRQATPLFGFTLMQDPNIIRTQLTRHASSTASGFAKAMDVKRYLLVADSIEMFEEHVWPVLFRELSAVSTTTNTNNATSNTEQHGAAESSSMRWLVIIMATRVTPLLQSQMARLLNVQQTHAIPSLNIMVLKSPLELIEYSSSTQRYDTAWETPPFVK